MAIDPTGMRDVIATIQPGALSERQQRIAAGLALLNEGKSYREAARVAKIPHATLWEYHNKGRAVAEREGKADHNVAAVTEVSVDISLMAAERVRDRLAENPEEWSNMDLVKAYGIATDKVINLSQRSTGGATDSIPTLARLLQGAKVTIEPKQPSEKALEVEAERVG